MNDTLHALAAFARLGWRETASDRFGLLARVILYSLPVLIYSAIWQATPLAGSGVSAEEATWYVMATEAIIFAPGYVFREVEEDIRTGAIEAALTRPVDYALARIAEEMGGTLLRLAVLGTYGGILAWTVTGMVPFAWTALPAVWTAAGFGALIALLVQVAIGFLTVWAGNPAPAYWIWQKLVFVLGGLFLPLTLYPAWLADIGRLTPCAAILFHPASLVFDASPAAIVHVLSWQVLWLAAAAILVAAVASAATRRLVREGI